MPSRETFAYRRGAQLKALRAAEQTISPADSIYAKAAGDFHVFCTLPQQDTCWSGIVS